ncbi:hypothetical protein LINGRAHAP2_LOCUS28833 [Linum grandiflorum]
MARHLTTNMRFLSCSIKTSANVNGRLLSTIFTAKQIVLRIIWPTLVIHLCLVFIYLTRLIGACPTGFVMTLLVSHSLGVFLF